MRDSEPKQCQALTDLELGHVQSRNVVIYISQFLGTCGEQDGMEDIQGQTEFSGRNRVDGQGVEGRGSWYPGPR